MAQDNIHDKFFKAVFSNKENAVSFLQNYLASELLQQVDFTTLTLEKTTFVDQKLKEKYSDMLYRLKIKGRTAYLYTLFDHKSQVEKYTALQLSKYIFAIWERHMLQHGQKGKLPIVLPIVVYHGKEKWKHGDNLANIIDHLPGYESFIPNFQYILFNLSEYSDADFAGNPILQTSLQLLKNIYSPELQYKLPNIFETFSYVHNEETAWYWFKLCMQYLADANEQISLDTLEKINQTVMGKGDENTMPTIGEILRKEGFSKGQEYGRQLAKRERRKEKLTMALKMQKNNIGIDLISEITGLDLAFLQRFWSTAKRLKIVV